ncbi:trehalase family glycosidase [Tenacibaculum tangerinum]|uniref:Trehalase family glycosidase n=1 Tax=Tenacibaculum tangerinum TaxID=3038772 RepID=A0ABY8L6U3_9FLAO|nr:trehalase family glycosidase [Tenacibaculum tangerinum]WGH76098.1 trehalase family glycosidase [Tenacibaculum tangerinum]
MIFSLNIDHILQKLLQQEDTDGDKKITIEDKGSKAFEIVSVTGEKYMVKGTYHLSNLLQELVISKNKGNTIAKIPLTKIVEPPVQRTSRMIRDYYWESLTRKMDETGIKRLISDTKNKTLTATTLRIYVPFHDTLAFHYYKNLETKLPIKTCKLPETITPEYVQSINNKPGILSLKLTSENGKIQGVPFVVPGGRFNEMYGWDSYFESIGLLIDGREDLAKAMADNFQYEIEHYGKILNANRSYYLTRTQPPFYTSLIQEVFNITKDKDWLKSHLETAIHEYETVWMVQGKRLTANKLNRYFAEGIGIPPEVEEGHYDAILKPFANKQPCTVEDYIRKYQNNEIDNPFLDTYFLHDRTVRESGHDTSYRIEGNCADFNLVELNALLYKYETDFAHVIKTQFNDNFKTAVGKTYTFEYWNEKAKQRQTLSNQYLWNASKGMYFDYDTKTQQQSHYIAATTFIPMWAEMASKEQAQQLLEKALPLLLEKGGIAGSTEESRGEISDERPQRQWDYPNGWAPHQMMIWKGLLNYGYHQEAQQLIYRWLYMITKNVVDYNGTIPEKYDVVEATHKVFAEYGNVGTDFEYITQEGFGWMNASYQYGLSLLDEAYIPKLNSLTYPEDLF